MLSYGMATPGYSGKALWQKLGLVEGSVVSVRGYPDDYAALIGLPIVAVEAAAFVHVFVTLEKELAAAIAQLATTLPATGVAWVSWPKKSSRVPTEISEELIRTYALPTGLVDVKVCAVSEVWSGLKLVWRVSARAGK